MKKNIIILITVLLSFVLSQEAHALLVDYADLSFGASARASSRINVNSLVGFGNADVRDVLGGSFSSYSTGERGNFIFDWGTNPNQNQWIQVDLGRIRKIDAVGAQFVAPGAGPAHDREVWDGVRVLYKEDISDPWKTAGKIGDFNDGVYGDPGAQDVFDNKYVKFLPSTTKMRWLRYDFGSHSPDWAFPELGLTGGGSRIFNVFASGEAGQPGVPEPGTMALMGFGLSGMGIIRRKRKK